jgi:F-type H+-transporting ATPase subunit delta
MNRSDIALRYAKALFSIDKLKNHLVEIDNAFRSLTTMMQTNRHLLGYLSHGQISMSQKKVFLEKLIAVQGFVPFLLYLIQKRRIELLPEISQHFHVLMLEDRGELEAKFITAIEVPSSTITQLENHLNKTLQKKSFVQTLIDPSLLAGAILIVGNRMVDYSMKGRLDRLRKSLLQEEVYAT